MGCARGVLALLVGGVLAGCGEEALSSVDAPGGNVGAPPPMAAIEHRVVEDFHNHQLVEAVSGAAELDVNQGLVTLPVEAFPRVEGAGLDMFAGRVERNGLVEAETILVHEDGDLEASDAVELRAHDIVRVAGTVRAGRGGVTLIAGRGVTVDGTIESWGPVRILVGDPDGAIEISGRITTHATPDHAEDPAPTIEILGRAPVTVTGQLTTHAAAGRTGGDIDVRVYGGIVVAGYDARVFADAEPDGVPGQVRLRGQSDVRIDEGAAIGLGDPVGSGYGPRVGGDIELQGQEVTVAAGGRVIAGAGAPRGGSVFLTAAGDLTLNQFAHVRAGDGVEGGSLLLRASRIGIGDGSIVESGRGRDSGAHFRIEAAQRLDLAEGSMLLGGNTACGPGGDVQVAVGGVFRARSGSAVVAGAGSVAFGVDDCAHPAPGGHVKVQARASEGVEEAARAGRGLPDGEVFIDLDPTLDVVPTNLAVGVSGQILSTVIDRGPELIGHVPVLVGWAGDEPFGTRIEIELAGVSDPSEPYDVFYPADDPEALVALADAQYFRYRVRLTGRAYDAPVLDYFELDFAAGPGAP